MYVTDRFPPLLRGAAHDVADRMMPELSSGDAKERAMFAQQVLQRLAAHIDVVPRVSAPLLEELNATLDRARRVLRIESGDAGKIADVSALREALAEYVRELALSAERDGDNSEAIGVLEHIVKGEMTWRSAVEAAVAESQQAQNPPLATAKARLTPSALTDYLRQRYPNSPELVVTGVEVLAGGRSKETIFLSLDNSSELPADVVMRQDTSTGVVDTMHGGTTVIDEHPLLSALARKGLSVAAPLLLEPDRTVLGPPFMIVEKLRGSAPGDWLGFRENNRALVEDLARVLGRLHSIDPTDLPLRYPALPPEEWMRRELEYRWTKWKRDTIEPSPIIECALAWLVRECRSGLGEMALVHGDMLPHNLLAHGDRITGIVDWEFAHVGDPAQDLAYCRTAVEAVMPWDQFLRLYEIAGGKPVSPRRLKIFEVYGWVRNCTFSATASRAFHSGETADFTIGAIGLVSIPIMELKLARLLEEP